MNDWLMELGIKIQDMVAGFAGGVVNAFVFKQSDPWGVVGSVLVGALTANYLGEATARQFGLGEGTGSFITGLCAMAVCQGIVEAAKRYKFGGSNGKA